MTPQDLLRHPLHSGHLTVAALRRNADRPVLFLGDATLTGGELAERISCYIQAFEALGAGTDATVGLLSLNRPEVLMIIGAGQTSRFLAQFAQARRYAKSSPWARCRRS